MNQWVSILHEVSSLESRPRKRHLPGGPTVTALTEQDLFVGWDREIGLLHLVVARFAGEWQRLTAYRREFW